MIKTAPFRLIAIVLLVALVVMVCHPQKADAMEPFTIIAIIGAPAIVIVLIAYLVIADEDRQPTSRSTSRVPAMTA